MMSRGTKFLAFLLTILIFMQLSDTPFAEQNQQCVPSSCGHIRNISYPFRLKSDPKHCGRESYELSCEGDRPIFTIIPYEWNVSLNYYVQAINYDNSTIRLVDPGIREEIICSLPQKSITFNQIFYSLLYVGPLAVPITLFSCPFAVNSPVFVEITNCLNRSNASNVSSDLLKRHTYATMAELSPSDLRVGCSVDLMSMTSWKIHDANANISILSLHNALAYGFEFSWFRDVYCDKCRRLSQDCEIENSRDVRCIDYSCKTYNFRFFKIGCGIIPWILPIAGLSVLARIVLFPCIFVFLMIELRRRHLSIFDAIESFLHVEMLEGEVKALQMPPMHSKSLQRLFFDFNLSSMS
ncbi:hypothetical protein RND71_002162 [Anisodus tanguticus]|uniref:Wall-associated receptor kinase galacturonan-binding domain-containing protein n=1 Tax=Anisodus tanguticus TaxID=243964 RepID=A0AAE1T2J1_9SOLA|nr:hypothetical protein RND71_002162 [Anisodus tanguticus]